MLDVATLVSKPSQRGEGLGLPSRVELRGEACDQPRHSPVSRPSPGSESLDSSLGKAGGAREDAHGECADHLKEKLRVETTVGVPIPASSHITASQARGYLFQSVGFLPNVADCEVANGPTLQQANRLAGADAALRAEALGLSLPAVERDDVAQALDADRPSPAKAAGGDAVWQSSFRISPLDRRPPARVRRCPTTRPGAASPSTGRSTMAADRGQGR